MNRSLAAVLVSIAVLACGRSGRDAVTVGQLLGIVDTVDAELSLRFRKSLD